MDKKALIAIGASLAITLVNSAVADITTQDSVAAQAHSHTPSLSQPNSMTSTSSPQKYGGHLNQTSQDGQMPQPFSNKQADGKCGGQCGSHCSTSCGNQCGSSCGAK